MTAATIDLSAREIGTHHKGSLTYDVAGWLSQDSPVARVYAWHDDKVTIYDGLRLPIPSIPEWGQAIREAYAGTITGAFPSYRVTRDATQ